MASILIDFMLLSNKTALYIFQLRGGVPKKRHTDLREGDVRHWISWWRNLKTGQLVIAKNEIYNIKENLNYVSPLAFQHYSSNVAKSRIVVVDVVCFTFL